MTDPTRSSATSKPPPGGRHPIADYASIHELKRDAWANSKQLRRARRSLADDPENTPRRQRVAALELEEQRLVRQLLAFGGWR